MVVSFSGYYDDGEVLVLTRPAEYDSPKQKIRRKIMRIFYLFFQTLLIFYTSLTAIPYCNKHVEDIRWIRSKAKGDLAQAIRLNGGTGSFVVTAEDVAADAVQSSQTYSDFCKTFRRCINNCNKDGKIRASGCLYKGLSNLSKSFLELYNNCIINHRNYRSVFERGKIHFDLGNNELCLNDMMTLIKANVSKELLDEIKPADLLLTKGQAFLEMGEYEKAIAALSNAIEEDPTNKEAYFHRASAYFETGDFNLALKDYLSSEKGKTASKSFFQASQEFTQEVVKSACQGASEAAIDFVPSMCSSVYGLSETLWTINQHPIESTKNFANACKEMADCVVDYYKTHDLENSIDECVDEVKILYEKFDQFTDREKGQLIGYAIGKYGIDIFGGGAVLKGVAAYRNLRNANRICNLEAMAVSTTNKEAVVTSALKHNAERDAFFKNVKIHWDRQNKHIPGKHNYEPGKSIFEHNNPQKLLDDFAGKGRSMSQDLPGNLGYKEAVDFSEHIGVWINKENTLALPTTKGTIHYSKNGAHIVPAHPDTRVW